MAEAKIQVIDVFAIRDALRDRRELALIDVREPGEFGTGHALLAVNLPLSELEVRVSQAIPRRTTRIIVQDREGGERARKAILRLRQSGYTNVYLAQGGVEAWQKEGHALFQGVNVPSKAFSEWVEVQKHTPAISAEQVHSLQQEGKPLLLLDGRTPEEFIQHHIPGAINCPNAELVDWFARQQLPDSLPVVITCAGRTRGIIGAQSLIEAGIRQPVAALAGGTQAWRIAGLPLNHGEKDHPLFKAQPAQPAFPEHYAISVATITRAQLEQRRADEQQTTYLFDVRTREEYQAGTLSDAQWLPGGQLIQTIDEYAATRGALIVLFDPTGSRALVTARWLYQLGWSVSVLQDDEALHQPQPKQPALSELFPGVTTLSPADAYARLTNDVQLLSADRSKQHLQNHVAGARWVNRARLQQLTEELKADKPVWIFAAQTALAWAIAWDLRTDFGINAQVITGDAAAWQSAGWSLTQDEALSDKERIDFLFWLHDRHSGNLQASRDYLAWEASLPDLVEREGLHGFRRLQDERHPTKEGIGV